MYGGSGVGLRGGTFTTTGLTKAHFRLDDVKWVEDLAVRGGITWNRATGAIQAKLVAHRADGTVARLTMGWNDWTPHGRALVVGKVDREAVTMDIPAP